jgi:hypothetical protein
METTTVTTLRKADLSALLEVLLSDQARKLDVVVPACQISADRGALVIAGTDAILDDDGVTSADGRYAPTGIAVEGLAEKLRIPLAYLRRLHADRPDLFDANVNGWLHGGYLADVGTLDLPDSGGPGSDYHWPADGRSFLVRCFRPDDEGTPGVARAVLSNGYGLIDHVDIVTAALAGVTASGVETHVTSCDLTDRRMYVKVQAPSVAVAARSLLDGYTSPYTGQRGADNPLVHAGFVIANSETGDGAATLTPQITVQVCDNGMTITRDVMRHVHLGARMDHGIVTASADTLSKQLALIEAQARDAVETFLDPAYVTAKIAELEALAGRPVDDPAAAVEVVTKRLNYTEAQTRDVLAAFIKGGQVTAGGVMQAVTAAAQLQDDADVAAQMEADGVRAMELAAAV